jgi:hypothetical protein
MMPNARHRAADRATDCHDADSPDIFQSLVVYSIVGFVA